MNYKEILINVLNNGAPKQPTRDGEPVENDTIGTFCEIFRHDMSAGYPLTTLRKMPFKSMCVELEGFIKGVTYKKWYQDRKCKFWDEWSSPESAETYFKSKYGIGYSLDKMRKTCQKEALDLGPIYGYQWRNFGSEYYLTTEYESYAFNGPDQLKNIVRKLKTNPYDRRMICSAWNPTQMDQMALPPCHYSWGVVVYGDRLNLHWNQRSVDCGLGLPNNIASYALLQLLLCKESGLKPGELVGKLEDCHIYTNHLPQIEELVKRDEKILPELNILDFTSIFDWVYSDVELLKYDPHQAIHIGDVTV